MLGVYFTIECKAAVRLLTMDFNIAENPSSGEILFLFFIFLLKIPRGSLTLRVLFLCVLSHFYVVLAYQMPSFLNLNNNSIILLCA